MAKHTIESLKAYAQEKYNAMRDGAKVRWDYVVECWDDSDYQRALDSGRPIHEMRETARLMAEQERNARCDMDSEYESRSQWSGFAGDSNGEPE